MKLADTIQVEIGGEKVTLTPRLRHAIRLERKHGLDNILIGLRERSLTIVADLLSDHWRVHIRETLAHLDELIEPLFLYTLACFGLEERSDDSPKTEPTMTFAEYHAHLYRVATGWLGYSPDVALNCTPVEIVEAFKGRQEMLRAIFGGSDQPPKPSMSLADKFRAAMSSFGTKKVKRNAKLRPAHS